MKKADNEWWKFHESLKLPDNEIRAKIVEALKLKDESAVLLDVFRDSFTYKLINPSNKSDSFHRVDFFMMMNEPDINWEKSIRIKQPKQYL